MTTCVKIHGKQKEFDPYGQKNISRMLLLTIVWKGSGEKNGSIVTDHPNIYSGDFASPEMIIPPGGMKDLNGKPIPWELCATMNNHWGYCYYDHTYKTSQTIIRKLVECVSKGGNFILNVGPDAKGRIPKESQEILTQVGEWMESKRRKSL